MKKEKLKKWNTKVKYSTEGNTFVVDVTVFLIDHNLKRHLPQMKKTIFTVKFKKYLFRKQFKYAIIRRFEGDFSTAEEVTCNFDLHMKFSFNHQDKAKLFTEGIERAIDLFIIEKILENEVGIS